MELQKLIKKKQEKEEKNESITDARNILKFAKL